MAGQVLLQVKGVHQFFKGKILVLPGPGKGPADLFDKLVTTRVVLPCYFQGHAVDEKTDHIVQLVLISPGSGRTDDEIVLPGIFVQEDGEGGRKQGEQGHLLASGQVPEL